MPETTTTSRTASGVRQPQDLAIAFDRVSLAFDDHVVLRDCSFTVPKGDMRILFGASGAGKSVILKLTRRIKVEKSPDGVWFGPRPR